MHDEKRYPNPDAFMPERFEADAAVGRAPQDDPLEIVFGFGRRCVQPLHIPSGCTDGGTIGRARGTSSGFPLSI